MLSKLKFDVLKDHPLKVMFCVMLPLVIVNIVAVFSSSFTNDIYSRYTGQIVFTVIGLLSSVNTIFVNIVNGTVSASWIKSASHFASDDKSGVKNCIMNAIYAIAFIEILMLLIMNLSMDGIFHLINIPSEVYDTAKTYLRIYTISYAVVSISAYFLAIINGVGNMMDIFIVNIINTCGTTVSTYLLTAVFKLGIAGVAMVSALTSVILLGISITILIKKGYLKKSNRSFLKLNLPYITSILRYGLILSLQSFMCAFGCFVVSIQVNRYLPLNYISVLSVSLPITGVMSAFSTACNVFLPLNYAAGYSDRVRKFLKTALICCVGYGVLCFAIYALFGNWYYGRLFDNPEVIAYGTEYWQWYGLSLIFVAVIFVIRISYEALGYGKLALICGFFEMSGNLICAFWLIPCYGIIGRNLSSLISWVLPAVFLVISYAVMKNKIYENCERNRNHS